MSDESNETTTDAPKGAYYQDPADAAAVDEDVADVDGEAEGVGDGDGVVTGDVAEDGADPMASDGIADADAAEGDDEVLDEAAAAKAARKAKADAAIAERRAKDAAVADRTVTRRTVTSRRVTPKAGTKVEATPSGSKARDAKKTETVVNRTATPIQQQVYAKGPSPWYVPAIMFGLLILGALIIMTNYMGVFGDASNVRLVIGLGFILGGIVTATQYR